MDPHFHEYLAAVAGMHELYGDRGDEQRSEFHDEHHGVAVGEVAATGASA